MRDYCITRSVSSLRNEFDKVVNMTGNDVVRVLDEWIDGYRQDWYSSTRSQYETNEIIARLTELQRMLHEALDKEIK